ncbi:unnamed protein product [Calypogeia fissa]
MTPGLPQYEGLSCATTTVSDLCVEDVMVPEFAHTGRSNRPPGSRRYVAVFYCGDFWDSTITFWEFDGNQGPLLRLQGIVQQKNGVEPPHRRDVHILNYDAPVPESVVSDNSMLDSYESLRRFLSAHLEAPFADGWKDCNQWALRNTTIIRMNSQLAMLPWHPPDDYNSSLHDELEDYPYCFVRFCIWYYVRPWETIAEDTPGTPDNGPHATI